MILKDLQGNINGVVEGLKSSPLALPLVVVNMLALVLVGYMLWVTAERAAARDALIADLAKNCQVIPK
jgi:hypothetical protein